MTDYKFVEQMTGGDVTPAQREQERLRRIGRPLCAVSLAENAMAKLYPSREAKSAVDIDAAWRDGWVMQDMGLWRKYCETREEAEVLARSWLPKPALWSRVVDAWSLIRFRFGK